MRRHDHATLICLYRQAGARSRMPAATLPWHALAACNVNRRLRGMSSCRERLAGRVRLTCVDSSMYWMTSRICGASRPGCSCSMCTRPAHTARRTPRLGSVASRNSPVMHGRHVRHVDTKQCVSSPGNPLYSCLTTIVLKTALLCALYKPVHWSTCGEATHWLKISIVWCMLCFVSGNQLASPKHHEPVVAISLSR